MSRVASSRVHTSMDRDTELALVERLRQGDVDAFDEVYAVFNTRLFTFLVRLSRRRGGPARGNLAAAGEARAPAAGRYPIGPLAVHRGAQPVRELQPVADAG